MTKLRDWKEFVLWICQHYQVSYEDGVCILEQLVAEVKCNKRPVDPFNSKGYQG